MASLSERRFFAQVHEEAIQAGLAAAAAKVPVPMVVYEADVLSGKAIAGGQSYFVPQGVCGFAWVSFKGNTAWGRWAKKQGFAKSAYGGGLQIWISAFGQSMEKKEAYAYAFAAVLNKYQIPAYAGSRMD